MPTNQWRVRLINILVVFSVIIRQESNGNIN